MIFTWILSNIKWLIIGVAIIALAFVGYNYYSVVKANGELRGQIASQEMQIASLNVALRNKDRLIDELELTIEVTSEIIEERDVKVREIQQKFEDVSKDLGTDSSDQAPQSLKDFFKRLQQ